MLFRNFEDCPEDLKSKLKKYNAFHSDRSVWQIICETPVLIYRFFFNNDYSDARETAKIMFVIFVGLAYILSPRDILDESTYGVFGLIDDFGIVGGAIVYSSILIFKAIVNQEAQ